MTRIDIFGGVRASVDDVALPPFNSRQAGFLALLVLARCRPVGASELVGWLWGEDAAPTAGNQLQRMAGQLRRRFEPTLEVRRTGQVILGANDGYRLDDTVRSDLFELDEQMADSSLAAVAGRRSMLGVIRLPPVAGLEAVLGDHPWYVAVERQCAGVEVRFDIDMVVSDGVGDVGDGRRR